MKAIEIAGHVDDNGNLHIDHPLSIFGKKVKVIILVPESEDIDDHEWVIGTSASEVFDFLRDEEEDIYDLKDGEPLRNLP